MGKGRGEGGWIEEDWNNFIEPKLNGDVLNEEGGQG